MWQAQTFTPSSNYTSVCESTEFSRAQRARGNCSSRERMAELYFSIRNVAFWEKKKKNTTWYLLFNLIFSAKGYKMLIAKKLQFILTSYSSNHLVERECDYLNWLTWLIAAYVMNISTPSLLACWHPEVPESEPLSCCCGIIKHKGRWDDGWGCKFWVNPVCWVTKTSASNQFVSKHYIHSGRELITFVIS